MKKQKKRNNFVQALEYIKEIRKNILTVILIFLFSAVIGFVLAPQLGFLGDFIKQLVAETEDLNALQLIVFILQNNLQSAFFGMIFGILFGVFPVINAFVNGVLLGYVFYIVQGASGFGQFWRILPHGVFELPAIFISLGAGLHLGGFIFAKHKKEELRKRLYKAANTFLFVVIPLLIIAAVIEGLLIALYK